MAIPADLNTMVHGLAVLTIFVAGGLGLVVCTIICLVIAEIASDPSGLVREYGGRPTSSGRQIMSEGERVSSTWL